MRRLGNFEYALLPRLESGMRTYFLIRLAGVCSIVVLALMLCVNGLAQGKNNGTAELYGMVKGANGSSVVLHLRALDENPVRYYDGYEENVAKDGSFHFAEIEAGAYQLETEASGFTLSVPETITLRAGESRKGVVISVTPSFSLCGRVTENGAPKDDTWVNAYRLNPEFGILSQTFLPHLGANGSFLIADVTPGTYYLAGYTTYYPGSFNFNGAKSILVGYGAPTTCALEIPLQYTGCHATKVSGHISTVPGDANQKYKVLFLATNPAGGSMPAIIASNSNDVYKPGDSFSASVCEGSYDVVLSDEQQIGPWGGSPTHKVVFDTHHVDIVATAIDGVELTPHAMASISGEAPGMTHSISCPAGGPRAHVSILRDGDGQFQTVDLDDKNRFSFRNVAPGEYTVAAGPFLREALYLDSILVDGKPINGRRFTVTQARPISMVINISGDVSRAAGHLSPDARQEPRWEVAWTRPKGSVEGKVLGISGASVALKLRSIRYNSNASAEYALQVGENGSFRFNAVDPGLYTLRAEGKGILTTEYGALESGERGTPIVVARGAHIQGLTLSPPKLSALCGKVTAPEGAPQASTRIFLQWRHGGSGGPPEPSEVLTDAEGRFRLDGLSPGEYFLASPLDVNRIVFFSPDGTLSTATPAIVQAGKDVGCGSSPALDLRVPPNYKKTYAFSGNVNGELPAAIGDRFWILLLAERPSGGQQLVAVAHLDAEHHFSFDNVPAGHFVLQLHGAYGPEPMMWSGPYGPVEHMLASQKVDIHDGMAEVSITPLTLPTVTGTVRFTDLPREWKNNFDVSRQRITLVPRGHRAPFSAMLSADGSFSIGPEDAGEYEVNLDLRAPLYLQSVRLDGREINGRYFHLSAGTSAKFEIDVNGDSGQVNARVLPDPRLPVAEPSVRETCSKSAYPEYAVVLFPDPLFARPIAGQDADLASTVQPRLFSGTAYGDRDNPTVRIEAVPPGHYHALALQGQGIMGWPLRREDDHTGLERKLWKALAALGDSVTVQAGGMVELQLRDKTADADRLASKLGVSLKRGLFDW
jgi:hypothetical protein